VRCRSHGRQTGVDPGRPAIDGARHGGSMALSAAGEPGLTADRGVSVADAGRRARD
jgi:hypothetical protein